jgi:hypothetical protein
MGLFDRALKNVIGNAAEKVLSDAVGNIVNRAAGKEDYPDRQRPAAQHTSPYPQSPYPQQQTAASPYGQQYAPTAAGTFEVRDHAYFAQILQAEFGAYQIAEFVPVSTLGGTGKPYDFGLSQNGRLVAAIMLTEHNRTNNAAFKGAQAACEAAGIPFINFFLHMPNERGYVVNRIKSFLGLL